MVSFDASEDKSIDDVKSGGWAKPGLYHVAVNSVDEVQSNSGTEGLEFEFVILAGTLPGQEDTTVKETFWITEKALPRLKRLAMAMGLLKPGEKKDVDFLGDSRGRQLIVEIEEQSYQDRNDNTKTKSAIAYEGFWPLGHADVRDVPVDASMVQAGQENGSGDAKQSSAGAGGYDDI